MQRLTALLRFVALVIFWASLMNAVSATVAQPMITSIHAIAFSPDSNLIALGGIKRDANFTISTPILEIRRSSDMSLVADLASLEGHETNNLKSLSWSPSGDRLASAGADGRLIIWNFDGTQWRKQSPNLGNYDTGITQVRWSPDGKWIAIAVYRREVSIWSTTPPFTKTSSIPYPIMGMDLAWRPDSQAIVVLERTAAIYPFDSTSGVLSPTASYELQSPAEGHFDDVIWVVGSNQLFLPNSVGQKIYIFDNGSSSPVRVLSGLRAPLYVQVSPDRNLIAYLDGNDNQIRVIDAANGTELAVYDTGQTFTLGEGFAWSPTSNLAFLTSTSAIPTVVTPPTATPTNTPIPTLRQTFNAPTCIVSCWEGIQPNVTTQAELEALLHARGINYLANPVTDFETEYVWIPSSGMPYIDTRNNLYRVGVIVVDEIVVEIILPVNIALQQIVQEYGAPTIANESIDRDGSRNTYLVYPASGLYFIVNSAFGLEFARNVRVLGAGNLTEYFTGIESNIQDCALYSGGNGCILATATPTNTPIPTLRQTFNAPTCIVSCWEGIQPNVTTQAELEALLQARGINYTANPVSDFETQYVWIPSSLMPYLDTRDNLFRVGVIVVDEIVAEIILPVNIALQQIVQEYGAPTIANESIERDGSRHTYLVYPASGLYFIVDSGAGLEFAWNVRVLGASNLTEYFTGIESNIQDCALYSGSNGCILATATPTAIP